VRAFQETWQNVRYPFSMMSTLKLPLPDTRHSSARHAHRPTLSNPLANRSATQAKLVLGSQQLLWTEQLGPQNLDSIVWPCAEVFWTDPGGDIRTALSRLHEFGYWFRRRSAHAISLQPEWCELCPFVCDQNV
jgi:hypothetical protein